MNARTRDAVWYVLAALLILDTIVIISVGAGINLGTLWPLGAGTMILCWRMARRLFGASLLPGFRPLRGICRTGLCAGVLLFVVLQILIISAALTSLPDRLDWIIVLGAGLRGDQPSLTLKYRLNRAVEMAQRYPEARIIVSGGQGPGETITEAKAMMDYLVRRGVTKERILAEDRSTSTVENLVFSRRLLDSAGYATTARTGAISSEFHLFRMRMLARRAGLEVCPIGAPSPWYLYPNSFVREAVALVKSFVFDRP